jgi:hypothetical protein
MSSVPQILILMFSGFFMLTGGYQTRLFEGALEGLTAIRGAIVANSRGEKSHGLFPVQCLLEGDYGTREFSSVTPPAKCLISVSKASAPAPFFVCRFTSGILGLKKTRARLQDLNTNNLFPLHTIVLETPPLRIGSFGLEGKENVPSDFSANTIPPGPGPVQWYRVSFQCPQRGWWWFWPHNNLEVTLSLKG